VLRFRVGCARDSRRGPARMDVLLALRMAPILVGAALAPALRAARAAPTGLNQNRHLGASSDLPLRDRDIASAGQCTERRSGHVACSTKTGPIAPSMPEDSSTARPAGHSVARWTMCLLFVCLALEVATIVSGLATRAPLARVAVGGTLLTDQASPTDTWDGAIMLLRLVAFAGTGIAWLTWLYRAYGNLTLVGSKRSRFTRRRAVGYWFIPLANLVLAYLVMKDLWLRSDSMNDRDGYDELPAPAFLNGWWGTAVSWGVLGRLVAYIARDARTPLDLTNATDMGLLVNVVGVVAALLAIKVVWEIDRRQQLLFSMSPRRVVEASWPARQHGEAVPRRVGASPAPRIVRGAPPRPPAPPPSPRSPP